MLFTKYPEISEVILNVEDSERFEPWMIMAVWTLKKAGFKKFAFSKEPVNGKINVGFKNNPTEVRYNNIAYGTAGTIWKDHGIKVSSGWTKNERKDFILFKKIDQIIIQSLDREEQGARNICLTFGQVLKSFAPLRSDFKNWKNEMEDEFDPYMMWGELFKEAVDYLDRYMLNLMTCIDENTY